MKKAKEMLSRMLAILLVAWMVVPFVPSVAEAEGTQIIFSGGHGTYTDYDNNTGLVFFTDEEKKVPTVSLDGFETDGSLMDFKYVNWSIQGAPISDNAPEDEGFYELIVILLDDNRHEISRNSVKFHIINRVSRSFVFDPNYEGAQEIDVNVPYGKKPSEIADLTVKRSGYKFAGWYNEESCETPFDVNASYEWDINQRYPVRKYAKWEELTKVDAVASTCTEDGTKGYWKDSAGNLYIDEYGETQVTEDDLVVLATGHKWGDPVYTWSDDESEVTASRKCQNDASHVETETVKTETVVVKEPTDTEDGILQVIATFKNSAFEKQVREYGFNRGAEDEYALISELTEWIKGGKDPLSLRFKNLTDDEGTFDQFLGIKVDDELVDEDNYTKEKGSVIVNLKPEYLEKLSVGEHTIEAMFIYGSVKAKFTIKEAKATEVKAAEAKKEAAKSNATKTGDSSPLLIAIIVMAVSALAIVTMIVVKKKKKN